MGLSDCRPTRAEIDLGAIVANFRTLRRHVGGRDVWPVVKADAYGHGAVEVARALRRESVAGFCVATTSEGRELRTGGVSQPILVMGGVWSGGERDASRDVAEYGLTAGIQDIDAAARLSRAARDLRIGPASVWLKVDTGMGRLGAFPNRVVEIAAAVEADGALSLDGLFSNLATADSPADSPGGEFVAEQAAGMERICAALDAEGLLPSHRTLANSAGAMHHACSWEPAVFTGVRPGVALYGASLNPGRDPVELRPAMRLVTEIAAVRELPAGASVGYGLTFSTQRPARIGVLPVGYHDGVPRSLSNRGLVWLRGRRVPMVGRISMDLTLVDITDAPDAAPGDEVVLFGGARGTREGESRDSRFAAMLEATMTALEAEPGQQVPGQRHTHGGLSVEDVAEAAGTIPHEILSRIGGRIPRVHLSPSDPAGDTSS